VIILKDAVKTFKMIELNFESINRARKILDLPQEATLQEIKQAYRSKVKKYHPDKTGRKDYEEKMAQINRAYETLLRYIEEYRFSFREEDVKRNDPARDMRRFSEDWLTR